MPPRSPYSYLPADDHPGAEPPLGIDITRTSPCTLVITPVGEADVCTVAPLREVLEDVTSTGHSHVVVDLDRLAFMDASALGVLVEARERLASAGGMLSIRCHHPQRRKLLSITGLDGLLDAAP